jgi:esterase/lipase superfamily enzyme
MPTPVIYSQDHINPFAHLSPDDLTTDLRIFYGTNREPTGNGEIQQYGNKISTTLRVGQAKIRFGDQATTWDDVDKASQAINPRDPEMPMYLVESNELATFDAGVPLGEGAILNSDQQSYVDAINRELERSATDQLLLYVNGAKFDFYYSCAMTAEVNHFAGRDLVGVAFAWPTHQNILEYGFGIDVKRAHASASILVELIELLAEHTDAQSINIISWSAGGRVASRALADLRRKYPDLDSAALRGKFRIKLALFAAADVPLDHFLERAPDIHAVTERLTIYQSDDDSVLRFGDVMMSGGERVGMSKGLMSIEEVNQIVDPLDRLEVIDVSHFKEERGFDITGHHYWFDHPWVNTDVLLNVRTGLPAAERGLAPTEKHRVWGFQPGYPKLLGDVTSSYLKDKRWK